MSAVLNPVEQGQKLISCDHRRLLWLGFDYDGLLVDLYGEKDADGYTVEEVALAGTRISLTTVFKDKFEYLDSQCFWELGAFA